MITNRDTDNRLLPNQSHSDNNEQLITAATVTMPLVEQNLEEPKENEVVYVRKSLSKKAKRRLKYVGIVLLVLAFVCLILAFIVFPLIFMNSIELQRLLMFTNLGLHGETSYFKNSEVYAGLRNLYVPVSDINTNKTLQLGGWHLLPHILVGAAITQENFDYEKALKSSNVSVLLYFHGTGEDRSSSFLKYRVFRYFFHVITFDYRSYGDSSNGVLSEDSVVNDCVQMYEWLTEKTDAPIFVWAHSLGTALATHSLARLQAKPNVIQPAGLVLEAAFTKMSEELYVHPYGKIFAWLPWFKATVIKPLEQNGFIFDTSKNILNITCPIMILCAEDDSIVPYKFGEELHEISNKRDGVNTTLYYQFPGSLEYDHYFIYTDPILPYFINYFYYVCIDEKRTNGTA